MAAVMHPHSHPSSRPGGILLNPSPARSYAPLPSLALAFPSHSHTTHHPSSLSSSSSSSSVSPSPASSTTNTPPPSIHLGHALTLPNNNTSTNSSPRARSGSAPAGRRIRFAPLPDPRREFDDDGTPFDSAEDLVIVTSPTSFPDPAPLLLAPHTPTTPTVVPPAINVTASTPSSTNSTFPQNDIQPPSPAATLKRTPSPSQPHPPAQSSSGLAKKLFRPFLFRPAATSEDTLPGLGLFKTSSRESSRSRDGGSEWGIPLGRWTSETLSLDKGRRGSTSSSKSAPLSAWAPLARMHSAQSAQSAPSSPKRRTTRLLNGRVYGAPRKKRQTPGFANVRDDEPEFVEWGYGGMGSVNNGASPWAKLQSDQKVVVGAYGGDAERGRSASRTAAPTAGTDDDGGGMAWVKRRREERERKERERREQEEREKAAAEAPAEEPQPAVEEPAAPVPAPAPAAEAETKEEAAEEQEQEQEQEKEKEKASEPAEGHIHTAVTVPAPPHFHHHSHSHSRTMSADGTPVSATPTLSRASTAEGTALVEEPAAIGGEDTEEDETEDDEDAEEDDEDEDADEEQTRKTAVGAGVEIVGRHAHPRE
ncbi:hypothetical protein DENSPDRAFT_884824 [Dentipellis sp. KUC8613]|nr:hypothetical protein DENSPDRAFT_884824 [Dentipellis sp. KUC8613]